MLEGSHHLVNQPNQAPIVLCYVTCSRSSDDLALVDVVCLYKTVVIVIWEVI